MQEDQNILRKQGALWMLLQELKREHEATGKKLERIENELKKIREKK